MKINSVIVYKVYLGLWSSYHLYEEKCAAFATNPDEALDDLRAQVCTSRFQATEGIHGQLDHRLPN